MQHYKETILKYYVTFVLGCCSLMVVNDVYCGTTNAHTYLRFK